MKAIGRHVILEMWGCQNLESVDTAERALREMVVALDVNLLDLRVYPFSPVGVTGIAIVSESHLVIHTWPPLELSTSLGSQHSGLSRTLGFGLRSLKSGTP